ncbi:hypothetical protein Xsto_01720 [Xenorhabdus stockiae]|uniref:Peptidase M10 metallopeptidase domain-containing protein n=1 Tax=Xenorhabdus stockiae TaxID=351614 RepID=A0A2D0KR41_9GAMM|nr:hypothetical protein [Xenorhabdus stockiae]PHM65775.1 hypothetical protein Xsto_01720 [Xenorhabdus stockiae]
MGLINKIFILIVIVLSFSSLSGIAADDMDDNPLSENDIRSSVVGLFYDLDRNPYNPVVGYGSVMRYILPDPLLFIRYIYPPEGHVDIYIAPLMRRAVNYWNNVLGVHFTIAEGHVGGPSNFVVQTMLPTMLDTSHSDYYLGDLEAFTIFPYSRQYEEDRFDYGITSSGIYMAPEIEVSSLLFTTWIETMGLDHSFREYAELHTYTILLHEIGHALGLVHPEDLIRGRRNTVTDTSPGHSRRHQYVEYSVTNQHHVPIMLISSVAFLLSLHNQIGEDLNFNNIVVSSEERRLVENQVSMICLPRQIQNNAKISSSKKNDECNYHGVYPVAKMIVPIMSILN